jgi:hypothetical protein
MLHQWADLKRVKRTVHVCPSTKFIYNRLGNSRLSFYLQEYKVILFRPSSLRYGCHLCSWRHDTQHNDIQHNDTQHIRLTCDTQYKRHSA